MIYSTPPQSPLISNPLTSIQRPAEKPKDPEPKQYQVVANDSLTSISEAQSVDLSRLWSKNTQIANADEIKPGDVLTIPTVDEKLEARVMISVTLSDVIKQGTAVTGGSFSGNTYFAGQCVWYIKNIVPWVQNGWGNGNEWVYKSGHRVSAVPAVGTVAAAIAYNHVALVTGVSGNNVEITEMNFRGPFVISSRTAPISEFQYILP